MPSSESKPKIDSCLVPLPLHVDPAVTKAGGLPGPLLTRTCTGGEACFGGVCLPPGGGGCGEVSECEGEVEQAGLSGRDGGDGNVGGGEEGRLSAGCWGEDRC